MELAAILTFSIMFSLVFLMIGLVGGWIFKQYQFERIYGIRNIHPEFFDGNGNILPDEVLAVKFDGNFSEDEDDYEDED